MVTLIRQKGGNANFIPEVDDIVGFMAKNVENKDVVLVMSSGGFGGIHQKILDQL